MQLTARKNRALQMLQPKKLLERGPNDCVDLTRDTGSYWEDDRLTIKCRDPFGNEIAVRVVPCTPMHFVMVAVAARKNMSIGALRFMLDGLRIQSRHTVENLKLEHCSQIDVLYGLCADL